MGSALATAASAVSLEPPYDRVWKPIVDDLVDAVAGRDETTFLASVEAHSCTLARQRALAADDVLEALRRGFAALRAALADVPSDQVGESYERLLSLEEAALLGAALGFATGLEETIDRLTAEVAALTPDDPVTGVMKEEEIVRRLGLELDRCRRMELSLGVFLVGVDCLDEVRHQGGPGEGSDFLCAVARLLGASLRQYDGLGRRGEDGFLAVLPDVSRRGLHSAIERIQVDLVDQCPPRVHAHFSFALSHVDYVDLGAGEMLEQLEQALARARSGGDLLVWV